MRLGPISIALVASWLGVEALAEPSAKACGGCFVPPPMAADAGGTQSGTVVTDHRIALAITSQGTTLWDQIQYVGDPAEFAWVLPITGDVVVGIGSDEFMTALDDETTPHIHAPTLYCNPPPGSGGSMSSGFNCGCGSASDSAESSPTGNIADGGQEDSGVTVTNRSVVGPYETVQLRGTGGDSIVTWLDKNGFEVPTNIAPVVQKYVDEKFGFLAVRLRPGIGVRAMKPIRVSWPGKYPSLPLRLVAAGIASSVGLKLFVIGDGRWRPKNFPSFTIGANEISWDFDASRSTYTTVRAQKAAARDNGAWGIESSISVDGTRIPSITPDPTPDAGTGSDAATDTASDGATDADLDAESVDTGGLPAPSDSDHDVAFHDGSSARVTRLRADLPVRHLNIDLELEADDDQQILSTELHPTEYTNADKVCTYGIAYSRPGTLMRTGAPAQGSASCAVSTARDPSMWGLAALAALGLVRVASRRRHGRT